MRSIPISLVVAAGTVLTVGGLIQAFAFAGLNPDLRLVYGWSVVAILGLFFVAWGLIRIAMSKPSSPVPPARSQSSSSLGVNTDPSAHSRTSRRR